MCKSVYYGMSRVGNSIVTESSFVVARNWKEWRWGMTAKGGWRDEENVLKLDNGDGCTILWPY